jgi:hypothetical protein
VKLAALLCHLGRPHASRVKYTWVTVGNLTSERPVKYCGRCGLFLEVLND